MIEEEVNGWLVDPGEVEPIVRALEHLGTLSQGEWTAVSRANLELAKRYTIEEASRLMVQTLLDRGMLNTQADS